MLNDNTIFDQKLLNVESYCYFIAASVSSPHIYLRFKGLIKKRQLYDDRVTYYCQIIEILESTQDIQQFIHNSKFRMFHTIAKRGHIKLISCFDLFENMSMFNAQFHSRFSHQLVVVPGVHVTEDFNEIDDFAKSATEMMNAHLTTQLNELQLRLKKIP